MNFMEIRGRRFFGRVFREIRQLPSARLYIDGFAIVPDFYSPFYIADAQGCMLMKL